MEVLGWAGALVTINSSDIGIILTEEVLRVNWVVIVCGLSGFFQEAWSVWRHWKACVFSKDQSGAEFKSIVNSTAVVESRAGVGKVIARVDKAERSRAFLGMVQRVSVERSPR